MLILQEGTATVAGMDKYLLIHGSSSFRNEGCRAVMISHLAGTWEEFAKEIYILSKV